MDAVRPHLWKIRFPNMERTNFMKRLYLSILFCVVLTGAAFGQSGELATMTADLQEAIGTVRASSKTYEPKISFIEPAGIQYSFDEIDSKGNSTSYVYEFNVADIDPYAIREQTQKDLITVALAVRSKQKLVKVYKNGEVQSYEEQVRIYAKDIDNARRIGEIIKNGIPAAERVMAGRLKLDGYEAMVNWLTNNVKNVAMGTRSYTQTIAETGSPGSLRYTSIETNAKGSVEETFTFNLADINPLSMTFKISGNTFALNFETPRKAKYIAVRRNTDARPFVGDMSIITNNVDEARDLRTVLTMLIPLTAEKIKGDMPAINSDSDAVAQIRDLTRDIEYGPKQFSQTIEPQCLAELTQTERDAKGSEKNAFRFNWIDVSPNNSLIEASGERLFINIRIADGKKMITSSKNDQFSGYDDSVRLFMPDMENARRAKFAIDTAVERCKAAYKEPFRNDVSSITSWFADNIKDVSVEQVTFAQKLEPVEQGNLNKWKYTKRELNPKGSGNEDVFEFNFSDINPLSIEVEVKGKWMYVVMGTEFKGKVISAYRNGKIMPYANKVEFAINDVDVARDAVNALKNATKDLKAK